MTGLNNIKRVLYKRRETYSCYRVISTILFGNCILYLFYKITYCFILKQLDFLFRLKLCCLLRDKIPSLLMMNVLLRRLILDLKLLFLLENAVDLLYSFI